MFSALKKLVGSEQAPGGRGDRPIPAGLQSMNQALQRRFAKGVQYNSECGRRGWVARGARVGLAALGAGRKGHPLLQPCPVGCSRRKAVRPGCSTGVTFAQLDRDVSIITFEARVFGPLGVLFYLPWGAAAAAAAALDSTWYT